MSARGEIIFGVGAAALAVLTACAPKQTIPFEACEAEKMTIYVDGRLLARGPKPVELRADLPHKLFFKRDGHEPRLIILEPTEDAGGALRLEPADPCQELLAVPLDRELTIEADEEKAEEIPAPHERDEEPVPPPAPQESDEVVPLP
jgi:hypothetical protein